VVRWVGNGRGVGKGVQLWSKTLFKTLVKRRRHLGDISDEVFGVLDAARVAHEAVGDGEALPHLERLVVVPDHAHLLNVEVLP